MLTIGVRVDDIGIGAFHTAREVRCDENIENPVNAVRGDPATRRFRYGFGEIIGRCRLFRRAECRKYLGTHRGPLLARAFERPLGGIRQRTAFVQGMIMCRGHHVNLGAMARRINDGDQYACARRFSMWAIATQPTPSIV